MLGMALIRQMIANLRFLFLEMSLRGLKIRSMRRAFRKLMSPVPGIRPTIAEVTMTKSRIFQPL
jgi:hypothetical protein